MAVFHSRCVNQGGIDWHTVGGVGGLLVQYCSLWLQKAK